MSCNKCINWNAFSGGCMIHNTVPGGCADYREHESVPVCSEQKEEKRDVMTLYDLIEKIDNKDTVQITLRMLSNCDKIKKELPTLNIFDMEVKSIKTDGCAMIFIEIG